MKRASLAAAFLVVASASPAAAIPRFASRQGAACSMCHVDPTGGGMRNDYGRAVYAVAELPLCSATLPEGAAPLDARVSDAVALGSDLRVLYHHMHRTDADRPRADSFYLMEAALYAAADLWQHVTLYLAPTLYGSETVFFEAAGIVRLPVADSYVKVGRFTAPYGLKLPDHTAFVRKRLGFGIRTRETGVEVGLQPGPVSLQAAVFNGIPDEEGTDWDPDRTKGLSARASVRLGGRLAHVEVGASGYYNLSGLPPEEDPAGLDARVEDLRAGAFGALTVGRFTWLGELDWLHIDDRTAPQAVDSYAAYHELAFLAVRGVDLVATYEVWDPDTSLTGDAIQRLGGGVELHPWPYTEVVARYRYTLGDDRLPLAQVHDALAMAHLYF